MIKIQFSESFCFLVNIDAFELWYWRMKKAVAQLCPTLCDLMDYIVHGVLQARILAWVVVPFSRDLPTQGLNPGLLHCRQILYKLSRKGSPGILEWVAYPFSRGSSQPKNWTRVSCIADSLQTELSGKPCMKTPLVFPKGRREDLLRPINSVKSKKIWSGCIYGKVSHHLFNHLVIDNDTEWELYLFQELSHL